MHAQYFVLINIDLKLQFCAEASSELHTKLLVSYALSKVLLTLYPNLALF